VTDPGKFVIHLGDASEKTPLQGELTINYQERGTHKQKGLPSDFGRPFCLVYVRLIVIVIAIRRWLAQPRSEQHVRPAGRRASA
jgi:hypothetical protein